MSLILNVALPTRLDELIVKFERPFEDIELVRTQLNLFNIPMTVEKQEMFHLN